MTKLVLTRRRAFQALGAGGIALALDSAHHRGAMAASQYFRNAVLRIDGEVIDLVIDASADFHAAATGPSRIILTLPAGSRAELIAADIGFGGRGYDLGVRTRERTVAGGVTVELFQPAIYGEWPFEARIVARSTGVTLANAKGVTNRWFDLSHRG